MYKLTIDYRGDFATDEKLLQQVPQFGFQVSFLDRAVIFSSDDDGITFIMNLESTLKHVLGSLHHPYLFEGIKLSFQSGLFATTDIAKLIQKKLEILSGDPNVPLLYGEIYYSGGRGMSEISVLFREPDYFEVALREFVPRAIAFAALVRANTYANNGRDSMEIHHNLSAANRELRKIRPSLVLAASQLLGV
jgi:hypothetical protein